MSQMPPQPPQPAYQQQYQQPQQKSTSGMAVTSLILGILGCCPGFSLLAMLFGILGIATTGKPNKGGRGLAITGLILGLLGTIGYAIFAFAMYLPFKMLSDEYEKNVAVILKDYNDGNDRAMYDRAGSELTSDVTYDEFHQLMERARSEWGKAEPMGLMESFEAGFNFNTVNNRTSMRVPLRFEKAGVQHVELVYESRGNTVSLQGIHFVGMKADGSTGSLD